MNTMHNLNCSVCSVTFESAKPRGRFCSHECKKKYARTTIQAKRKEAAKNAVKPIVTKACAICNALFAPTNNKAILCSDICKKQAATLRRRKSRRGEAKPVYRITKSTCAYCAKQYKPKASNRITYCSRECAFTHKSDGRERKELVAAEIQGIRRLKANAIVARNRRERDALMKRVNRCTAGCGRITHIGTYPKRCDQCIRIQENKAKAKAIKEGRQAGGNARKRAKHYGVKYEHVKPIEIAMRHGMRCALCRVSTPWSRRGTKHHNAPEIDHITPISKGGDHIADNLQLLCRKCNGEKNNHNSIGQPALEL